ncbi:MAG: type IIA DNA topoisomerase subunit B [Candidatus Actinomarina sp.]|nr:type IIA DNA topoisomerase subunit B [Candidatus Actinomarina sp.]MBL6760787.1 type IIA DNA topoisomerase subunit B [Ilumatobacteraceae bacterium]MBL6762743.1 type IIA DNA topoisomerase subunit B [Candidatus Actinomarina sp.]MBL6836141.1 type IIA DNA topoisomerase subunit B [Candidatus Actinomarina sp.]
MSKKDSNSYDSKDIKILEGLEAVRKRPAMYIGSTGPNGLHHLIWEVLDNSVDEAMAGRCSSIKVSLEKDGSVTVEDDGSGIPVKPHPKTKVSALTTVLTTLHAGGKFESGAYTVSGGLHGVGISVVNALSTIVKVEVQRDGHFWNQDFDLGKPKSKIKRGKVSKKTGTKVNFLADPKIFNETQTYEYNIVSERLRQTAFLNKGLKISLIDNRVKPATKEQFHFKGGLVDFVEYLNEGFEPLHDKIISFSDQTKDSEIEVALQWKNEDDVTVKSFANNIHTLEGGTHEEGLRTAVTKAINDFAKKRNLHTDISLTGDDIREGMTGVVSVRVKEPQFEGQTKTKLGNTEMKSKVQVLINEEFPKWLSKNTQEGRAIVERCAVAAKARMSAKKARELTKRKSILETSGLPGKLADCSSTDPTESELFIVEGDSAAGPAKQARDSRVQAILPIRGKIINVQKVTENRALQNEEISALIKAIGTGIKTQFNKEESRYDKIIFLTDADVDGAHIRTLLLTFFFKFMPGLITSGKVWISEPPLYRLKAASGITYLKDDEALKAFKKENKNKKFDISRFKGLGEMNAGELWDTAMNPETRTLIKVTLADAKGAMAKASDMFEVLMGNDVSRRKLFIEKNAKYVRFLDV